MTISQISSGTLIDQKVLSELITTVNAITSSQYTATSSLANGLSTSQQNLQNGQWAVSTQFEKPTISTYETKSRVSGPFSVSFGMSFDPVPMVTGTIYSSVENSKIQDVASSIIVTNITSDGFTYKIVVAPAGVAQTETIGVMFTAIGKVKKIG